MARKCSQCGKMGHNSRTCRKEKGRKIKLFGVQIDAPSKMNPKAGCVSVSVSSSSSPPPSLAAILNMKKSLSTGSLQSSSSSCSSSLPSTPSSSSNSQISSLDDNNLDKFFVPGYAYDGRPHPHKRKGVPWTEEEHKTFLRGLEKLGKGDWRGISREFVRTRTPTQVASHAQKYFLRQLHPHNLHKRSTSETCPTVLHTEKSRNLGFEQAKDSKCKPSDNSIQFGVSSPKTTSTMHNNKHETGEPLLTNIWIQDLHQTSPNEELNLELTLESGKSTKSPSIVPPSCLISFAT